MGVYQSYIILAFATIVVAITQRSRKIKKHKKICLGIVFTWMASIILCFATIHIRGDFKPIEYWLASFAFLVLWPRKSSEKTDLIWTCAYIFLGIVAYAMIVPPLP